jgi:hypothetical protein
MSGGVTLIVNYTVAAFSVIDVTAVAAERLSKARVRLAFVLNNALQYSRGCAAPR